MRRVLALTVLITCVASAALACEDPYDIRGIIYDSVPANTSPSATILKVAFDAVDADRGPLVARITGVVQGGYAEPTIRVGILNSSCLYPFIFGTRGLMIGEIREGVRRHTFGQSDHPVVLTQGFEGVWFQPETESVTERRNRTGIDALGATP
jgi:hypothetical protein